MIRHAARQFTGWTLVRAATAECPECGAEVAAGPASLELALWLDKILDHDWEHSPEARSAPVERIDSVLGDAA